MPIQTEFAIPHPSSLTGTGPLQRPGAGLMPLERSEATQGLSVYSFIVN